MKVATKFVSSLNNDQKTRLQSLMDTDVSRRIRMRAHSILLSSKGTPIDEIAQIYQVHRDTVSSWVDRWESLGVDGLSDRPRCGGPTKLNEQEQVLVQDLIRAHPQSPKMALAQLTEKTGKTISRSTLKRIVKSAGLSWKRVRKSTKSKRDDQAFEVAKKDIKTLKKTSERENRSLLF